MIQVGYFLLGTSAISRHVTYYTGLKTNYDSSQRSKVLLIRYILEDLLPVLQHCYFELHNIPNIIHLKRQSICLLYFT